MTQPAAAQTTQSEDARALSRSQTVFMVTALAVSVAAFMLNATMFSPAIRDINAHLGRTGMRRCRPISFSPGRSATSC
jgi:hypothetical protein